MKLNLVILMLFIFSCTTPNVVQKTITSNQNSSNNKTFTHSSKGFAYVLDQSLTPNRLQKEDFFVSHNKLKMGSKIRVTNPENMKSIEVILKKRVKYDNFYKVLISESIIKELDLDPSFPYVEVNEIKVNKSFVAEKAITEKEEQIVSNKAPVAKINIDNISKAKPLKKDNIINKSYLIVVAEFYNLDSAELLKERLNEIMSESNYQMVSIKKINDKSFQLIMGPYNTINKLKNDYNILSKANFEDLDIKIND